MKSILAVAAFSLLTTSIVSAEMTDDQIVERIKPIGFVCIEGDDTCGSSAPVVEEVRSGKDIVAVSCNTCHGTGILGAPKIGTPDWAARVDEKGVDTLLTNALNGINAMPAKGNCVDCSDDEIKSAIDYMIEQSK
jgi:cytochrome c5